MAFPNLEALFYMASKGDKEAFILLHEEYVKKALLIIQDATHNMSKSLEIRVDFDDLIEDSFIKINNDYDAHRGSYTWFMRRFLSYKILDRIKNANTSGNFEVDSLDDVDETGKSHVESLEDVEQLPMGTQIAMSNFKYQISSPKARQTRNEKARQRILLLRYAGFSDREICKELKMTLGVFRGLIRKMEEDEELLNFKLDLK